MIIEKKPNYPIGIRLKKILIDFYNGIKYGYPICCILRFCWDILHNRLPCKYRCDKYPSKIIVDKYGTFLSEYVPCMIFHNGRM